MIRHILFLLVLSTTISSPLAATENQVLELRTYALMDKADEIKLDTYLEHALIPGLKRQGLGPIGAFEQAGQHEGDSIEVLLLIPGPSADAVTAAMSKLSADKRYLEAAEAYLSTPAKTPLVKRIHSELLMSFDCWPQVIVPQQKTDDKPRLFELRSYESATEQKGQLKVEMFNSGEVPIFLDCGIAPVFMGQALIGDKLPNLTYMTVYANSTERDSAWKKFVAHPDWKILKQVKKFQNTVSKIHKSDWTPKRYSEL